ISPQCGEPFAPGRGVVLLQQPSCCIFREITACRQDVALTTPTPASAGIAIDLNDIKRQDTERFRPATGFAAQIRWKSHGEGVQPGAALVPDTVNPHLVYISRGFHEGSCCCQTSR